MNAHTDGETERVLIAMVALGDQVQALCQNAGIEIAAFVIFSVAGPIEYRSPFPRETLVERMRAGANELEHDP